MARVPRPPPADLPLRVACYARTSTEDQAERDTVAAQTDFLKRYCDLHALPVAGVYVDDGVSGTTLLSDRPEGRRLLDDARRGLFGAVLVYRLDRLGRSTTALLTAHDRLADLGIAIRSGTEPFDTATPFGKLVFTLLGSIAELERSTISERLTRGRDRVARTGQYTGGPIPFGYDLDADSRLIPSERMVPHLGLTEADYVRDLFRRVASHEATISAEAIRLTTLGVPRVVRYGGARGHEATYDAWHRAILLRIIHGTVYRGAGRVRSQFGHVERPTTPLVDTETWEQAQEALVRNRRLARKNAKTVYLLRGLIRCGLCGWSYVGTQGSDGKDRYRCASQTGSATVPVRDRCGAGSISAARIESDVWQRVRDVVGNPDAYVAAVRERLEHRADDDDGVARAAVLEREIAAKVAERERVRELARRGAITMDEAAHDLDTIARETAALRDLLDAVRVQSMTRTAQREYVTSLGMLLSDVARVIMDIDATDNRERKRQVIERLVWRVVVETEALTPTLKRRRTRTTPQVVLYGEEATR